MESLVAITEQKALNPQGQVKMYFSRIVEYEQGVISSKIEQLNTRIAEQASAAQSLEQLKLKYENLSDRLNQIPTE
jgi:cell shape-determining protein MreC